MNLYPAIVLLSFARKSEVVGMGVRDEDGLDVFRCEADRRQSCHQLRPFLRTARVDDGCLAVGHIDVEVVMARSEPMDATSDLDHGGDHRRSEIPRLEQCAHR